MTTVARILQQLHLQPVLMDAGASGAPPAIWRPIAAHSAYIGFDPDARELRRDAAKGFKTSTILPHALVADERAEATELFLTRSPFCSSTLPPRNDALSDYLFAPVFDVVGTTRVPATSIAKIIAAQGLAAIDWMKVDTQGTDLRLYQSVPEPQRARMLAVDIEPGLIDAYSGEDLFVSAHEALARDGWWLSAARVNGAVRVSRASAARLAAEHRVDEATLAGATRVSPAWVEARYLRTLEQLHRIRAGEREYQLLWCFAMLDRQYGFAFDVAEDYAQRCEGSYAATTLRTATLAALRRHTAMGTVRGAFRKIPLSWRRSAGGLLDRLRGR